MNVGMLRGHVCKMNIVEMRMIRWISGNTREDRIWNEEIPLKIGVTSIEEKMGKSLLRWFGHAQRSEINEPWERINLFNSREWKNEEEDKRKKKH